MFADRIRFHLQCKLGHLSQASYWYWYTKINGLKYVINGLKYAEIKICIYNPPGAQKKESQTTKKYKQDKNTTLGKRNADY